MLFRSQSKLRPAIVLADAGRQDWILCQVTSKPYGDTRAIPLNDSGFESGSLRLESYMRPGKLFTAHQTLIVSEAGLLKEVTFNRIIDAKGVHLFESIEIESARRALVLILDEPMAAMNEAALLSEDSLAQDWNRSEEDAAWSHLQPGK